MNPLSRDQGPVHVEVEHNQWLSRAQLDALQLDRFNALLKHAVERTPFHRARLGSKNGKAPSLTSLSDLNQIPILTKKEIQNNLERLVVEGANRSEWIKNATGGSTGEPLVFYRDQRAQRWVEGAKERFRRWLGCLNEDKLALIWGADRDFPPNIPPHERWLNVFNCRESDIERYVLDLVSWKPRTIRGYAGSLHLVAQFIKSRGLPQVRPNAVESAAETLTEEMRKDIQEAFGAPVFNFYGAREISCIACEDELQDGLLVADDVRLVEVIRDGKPAAPGEEGKLVITDLVNYAMPLIRYEIGDVGVVPPSNAAPHSRAFTRIQRILGRTANTITAPDGRLVHGEFFTHLFYHKPGISNFQVRQNADASIDIQVVAGPGFDPASLERVTGIVREHLGGSAVVRSNTVADIPTTRTGKRMFTISELPIRFDGAPTTPLATAVSAAQTSPVSAPTPTNTTVVKPRILMLADRPGWAFDINAQGIAAMLGGEFEFRIEYVVQKPDLNAWPYDVLVVMFWGEDYHLQFKPDPRRVVKQVSSHRWALEDHYGKLTAEGMVRRYLADASSLIVPSRRLHDIFAAFRPTTITPKGIDPARFDASGRASGPMRVGWVGNRKDRCKGLEDILQPAVGKDFEFVVAGGELPQERMAEFYRSIDVLCVASTAEGDPRPLIEGMASGCFPVAVDVGIVPELVRHRDNGLIVERKVEAFQAALQWCRFNLDWVRNTAVDRSAQIRKERSWETVAGAWRSAFQSALRISRGEAPITQPPATPKPAVPARPHAAIATRTPSNTATSPATPPRLAAAYDAEYALPQWESRQAELGAVFRIATGSPHAPKDYRDAVTYALECLRPHHRTIVDIGAWIGNFVLNAAISLPESTVFALEPEPANFVFLAKRAPANLIPLRLAVSAACGQQDIYLSKNSQGHTLYKELLNPTHSSRIPIRTITFPQLLEMVGGSIDLLKINAEGAEFDILRAPGFDRVKEAILEIHLEGTIGAKLMEEVSATHDIEIIEDRSPRFLFVHLRRKQNP